MSFSYSNAKLGEEKKRRKRHVCCAAQGRRTTVYELYELLSLSVAKRYDQSINSTRPEGKQRTAYAVRVRSFAQLWHVAKTNLLRTGVAGP